MEKHLALEKVESFDYYKTWKAESKLIDTEFDRLNLFYGKNGSGKSSLAKILCEACNKRDINYRLYNNEYIEHSLLLENKKGIKGVVSNFSKHDVNIESNIKEKELKIAEIKKDKLKSLGRKAEIEARIGKTIDEIVDRRRGNNSRIKNKSSSKTTQAVVKAWEDDYANASKQFPDEDFTTIDSRNNFSAVRRDIESVAIPTLQNGSLEDEINRVKEILGNSYDNVEIPSTEVVSWLEKGIELHSDDDKKCKFCNGALHYEDIKKKVQLLVDNKRYQDSLFLANYAKTLEDITTKTQNIIEQKDLCSLISIDELSLSKTTATIKKINELITPQIGQKVGNMELVVDKIDFDAIYNLAASLSELADKKKRSLKEVDTKINRLEILIKGAIGFEIKNSKVVQGDLIELTKAEVEIERLNSSSEKLNGEVEKLRRAKSDLSDFAQYLNEIFGELNMDFRLVPEREEYVLKHRDNEDVLLVDEISEGERNLLALTYFYYEMIDGSSWKIKSDIEAVIVDDPSSSLDSENYFYITTLVKEIMEQKTSQIFIMTHSWEFYCDISYGSSLENDGVKKFTVMKNDGVSNLALTRKLNGTPYKMLYKEVYDFSQKDIDKVEDSESLHMPNSMRRLLEEYAKFKVNIDLATMKTEADISKALFNKEIAKISKKQRSQLTQLLNVCNILSHKVGNHPKEPSEIHHSARFLMNVIRQNDKFHHLKMIE